MSKWLEISESLREDGLFVWKRLLPHNLIDEHLQAFHDLNARLGIPPGADFHSYATDMQESIKSARYAFHAEHAPTLRMIFNEELTGFLKFYFGEAPVMRQPETGLFHRKTPDHTDSLDFKVSPAGREVRVWCALEDIHPDSGPVYFVKGSHRLIAATLESNIAREHADVLPVLRSQLAPTTAEEYFAATAPLWRYIKNVAIPRAIEANGLERTVVPLVKGDAVVFSSDLVHGTSPCQQPGRTRKYFVAYWSGRSAVWRQSRAYWGPPHDFRSADNAISAPVHQLPCGLMIRFEELHAAYLESFKKPVVEAQSCCGVVPVS